VIPLALVPVGIPAERVPRRTASTPRASTATAGEPRRAAYPAAGVTASTAVRLGIVTKNVLPRPT